MTSFLPTARLLPLLVVVAVFMLGARGYDFYKGWGASSYAEEDTKAALHAPRPKLSAEEAAKLNPPAKVDTKTIEHTAPTKHIEPVSTPTPAPAEGDKPTGKAPEATAEAKPNAPELPERFTASEVQVLQNLSLRRNELDARAAELDQRQALLSAAEAAADQKIKELEALRAEIQGLIKNVDDQQNNRIASMVKMYETMKPREAAAILEKLDMGVTLDILERMKESKSAPILASMDPARAGEVTVEMSRRSDLPKLPE